jgi:acyl-CoA thioester hydrolase
MIGFDEVRLHIYQYVIDTTRDLVVATGEHMMMHVDIVERRRAPVDAYMRDCLARALDTWRPLQAPKGLNAAIRSLKDAPIIPDGPLAESW